MTNTTSLIASCDPLCLPKDETVSWPYLSFCQSMSDLISRHSRKNTPPRGLCPWPWYVNCFPVARCTAAFASNRSFNYIIIAFRSQTSRFHFNYGYRGLIYIRDGEEGDAVWMDGGTDSQMARYLSLSIMLYCLRVAKLATCTGCGEQRGNPAAPGGLSLEIGVGGLGHQVEMGDDEDSSDVLADWPKQQGKSWPVSWMRFNQQLV